MTKTIYIRKKAMRDELSETYSCRVLLAKNYVQASIWRAYTAQEAEDLAEAWIQGRMEMEAASREPTQLG